MATILIIKLGALGDVLRTTCILPGLHQKYPDAKVSWVTSGNAVCLLKDNPLIDAVIPMDDAVVDIHRRRVYDLVVNLDDEIAACKLAAALHTRTLFGAYHKNGKASYTKSSRAWFDMSLISTFGKKDADRRKRLNRDSYPDLLFTALGIAPGRPSLHLSQAERGYAKLFTLNHLEPSKPVVGLNTGAGSRWQYKQLGIEKTIELADHLAARGDRQILLYGGPEEQTRNQEIIQATGYRIIDSPTNNSILQFAALIELVDVLVTSDSLALHIASSLGIATVAFFGPTSASEIKLYAPGKKIVAGISCVCCYKKACDFSPTCMDVISTDEIVQAVEHLLSL